MGKRLASRSGQTHTSSSSSSATLHNHFRSFFLALSSILALFKRYSCELSCRLFCQEENCGMERKREAERAKLLQPCSSFQCSCPTTASLRAAAVYVCVCVCVCVCVYVCTQGAFSFVGPKLSCIVRCRQTPILWYASLVPPATT